MKKWLLRLFRWYGFAFALLVLGAGGLWDILYSSPYAKQWDLGQSWIVSPAQAVALEEKGASLLDARDISRRFFPRVPSAQTISWEDLSEPDLPNKGKLLPKNAFFQKWKETKIPWEKPILVLGDPLQGWGEEGRLVWSLRSMGHKEAFFVDGGASAYINFKKRKEANKLDLPKSIGKLNNSNEISISKEELKKTNAIVLDVREEREFLGETPYGESRGGHIPGAKWVYFKDLVDQEGFVRNKKEIADRLGILDKETQPIVSYCTGGVRSGFTTAILVSYGWNAKNYPGSMWEWASSPTKEYPLEKGK